MHSSSGRSLEEHEAPADGRPVQPGGSGARCRGRCLLLILGCGVLSLALHLFAGLGLDLRSPGEVRRERLVLLRFAPPAPAASGPESVSAAPASSPETPATKPPAQVPARRPAVRSATKKGRPPLAKKTAPETSNPETSPPAVEPERVAAGESAGVPVGHVETLPGVTVLANESGQDTLKHGAEARFMHGVATEEFTEGNYVGEYILEGKGRIWIEDDRNASGYLVLHAEPLGLHRRLFRFNRFIYIYGPFFDSPDPVQGTVTFFSDGYHIHQFLLQHESSQAYFPRRK